MATIPESKERQIFDTSRFSAANKWKDDQQVASNPKKFRSYVQGIGYVQPHNDDSYQTAARSQPALL